MTTIKPSVITSFDTIGVTSPQLGAYGALDECLRSTGRSEFAPLPVEVYVAMEPDFLKLSMIMSGLGKRTRPLVASDLFVDLTGDQLKRVASEVSSAVLSNCGPRQIVALATFLPEITRRADGGKSGRALGNMLLLGKLLRLEHGHPLTTVEVVCGSRFAEGSGSAIQCGNRIELEVFLDEDEVCQERLVERLCEAVSFAKQHDTGGQVMPNIALELEPGPFFVLRDTKTLLQLADRISQSPSISSVVGFNLDMAHWRIANVDVGEIRKHEAVLSRIVHAHISGHHPRAHLGDSVPTKWDWVAFQPWIETASELCAVDCIEKRSSSGLPLFSGYVSVEMEASFSLKQVAAVVQALAARLP